MCCTGRVLSVVGIRKAKVRDGQKLGPKSDVSARGRGITTSNKKIEAAHSELKNLIEGAVFAQKFFFEIFRRLQSFLAFLKFFNHATPRTYQHFQ